MGLSDLKDISSHESVEVVGLCDVDSIALEKAAKFLTTYYGQLSHMKVKPQEKFELDKLMFVDDKYEQEFYLKKLQMRSLRRGTKEMDIILGKFSKHLKYLSKKDLSIYEELLTIDDNRLYRWFSDQEEINPKFKKLIIEIKRKIF